MRHGRMGRNSLVRNVQVLLTAASWVSGRYPARRWFRYGSVRMARPRSEEAQQKVLAAAVVVVGEVGVKHVSDDRIQLARCAQFFYFLTNGDCVFLAGCADDEARRPCAQRSFVRDVQFVDANDALQCVDVFLTSF